MEKRQTSVLRLDENVILTMLIVGIGALVVFAFRYKNSSPCMPFTIQVKAAHFFTGEVIRFETSASSFKKLEWNFGDNRNPEFSTASSAFHTYDQPGEYEIIVSADNKCSQNQIITILSAPRVPDPSRVPTVEWPQLAEVGKPVVFKDTTKGANQWEWRFGEKATVDATTPVPSYIYSTSGYKTVSLIVNNDKEHLASYRLFVNPAPPKVLPKTNPGGGGGRDKSIIFVPTVPTNDPLNEQLHPTTQEPAPAQLTGADITKPEIEAKLRQVADKLLTAESFSAYMCGNLNIPVSVNGTEITFTAFCNQLSALKNSKKIKRLDVQMFKVDKTHCIYGLNVNFKKKEGFLGIGN